MKTCPRCGETKSLDDFHRGGKPDGRQVWCKACRKVYDHDYFAATRELRMAQKRGEASRDQGMGAGARGAAVRRLWPTLPPGRHALRPSPGRDQGIRDRFRREGLQSEADPGRDREVRSRLRELPRCQDISQTHRGVAQPGRAPALGAGGFVGSSPTAPTQILGSNLGGRHEATAPRRDGTCNP